MRSPNVKKGKSYVSLEWLNRELYDVASEQSLRA